MSYYEAKEDGILISRDKRGNSWYHPPCRICGQGVPSWSYPRGKEYCCTECRKLLVAEHISRSDQPDAKEKRFETAVKRIGRVADLSKYEKAIETVRKSLHHKGWFQSTEEIMAAIELIRRGYKINHQVKVFDYKADFVIPELKVILEIDGRPFHGKEREKEEMIRDEVIVMKFGEEWNVIHIQTDNINKNITKLIPAIKSVIRYREKRVH